MLTTLILSNNHIEYEGAEYLAKMLHINKVREACGYDICFFLFGYIDINSVDTF
jgi:hypothetical protein